MFFFYKFGLNIMNWEISPGLLTSTNRILGKSFNLVPVNGGPSLIDELAEQALKPLKVFLKQLKNRKLL